MMGFEEILFAVYEIQGCADSGDSPSTLAKRMERIREIADCVMRRTGYIPPEIT